MGDLETAQLLGGNDKVLHEAPALIQRTQYTAEGLPLYVGLATPGSVTSAAVWQIRKLTYSGNNVTEVNFADGDNRADNVWDDRAGLDYS